MDPFKVKTEDYFKGNQFSINSWRDKYALTDRESNYPAYAFLRWASLSEYETDKKYWRNRWFWEFFDGYWRPAGSILAGIGEVGGVSLENCTTISIDGDSLEEIFNTAYRIAKSAAYRQGLGVDISRLRPRGAKVKNSAKESTGSINWMSFFNSIGRHVGQKGRIPAMLFSISIKHPDVLEFIKSKSELNAIENANISVQITDDFMLAYEQDNDWTLSFTIPENNQTITKTLPARELMRILSEHACIHAEPGVQFIDTARKKSTTDVMGYPILSTNACSEKFMTADSGCLLGSINLGAFPPIGYNLSLEKTVQSAVRFLDNAISYELDHNKSPFNRQKEVISSLREIGLGVTNLHGWLLKENIGYDSDLGIEKSEEIMKHISLTAWQTSINLGKEKGNCPAFSNVTDLTKSEFFKELPLEVTHLRNAQVISIAPTGTISLVFPDQVDSTGIEPCPGFYWWKRARTSGAWKWYFSLPDITRQRLIDAGYDPPMTTEDPDGKIGEKWVEIIKQIMDPTIFKPAHYIDPLKKVELMSRVGKWVDASISVTYNLPEGTKPETIEKIYYEAWKKGVKSVAVYVDKSRQGVIEFEFPKNRKIQVTTDRPTNIPVTVAPIRPKDLDCDVYILSAKGTKFCVMVGLMDGKPYEVFATETKYVHPKFSKGKITKIRRGVYNLVGPNETIYGLSGHINNPDYADYTRMISTMLRHGIPVDYIVEQLEKVESSIVSFQKALARVLRHYVGEYYKERKTCSDCGSNNLSFTEGCYICQDCGSSKCG